MFRPYFIVGKPQDESLLKAYRDALEMLKLSPQNPEVFEEQDLEAFTRRIEDDIRSHDTQTAAE